VTAPSLDKPTQITPTLWFVGLTTLDVIHRGAAPAHRDQKVTANWQGVSAGGPAANAAVVAATLGAKVVLFTALGNHPAAAVARMDLMGHGVQVVDVADAAFQFPVSAILVDERTSQRSVVSLDGSGWAAPGLLPPDLSPPADALVPAAVLFDGHHPHLARQVAAWIPHLTPRPKVILDGGRWRDIFAELIPMADVAALSQDFQVPAPLAQGTPSATCLALGAKAVVITHGPATVEWATAAEFGTVPVPAVQALDTLGAGDAFHGALTYYLAKGAPLPEAIAQANRVAATKVQHLGNRNWLSLI